MSQIFGWLVVLVLLQGFFPLLCAEVPETKMATGVLSTALPSLSNFLNDTHLDELISKSVDWGFRAFANTRDKSGDIPLEGTRILFHYHVTHCWNYGRKRLLDFPTITKTCNATVHEDYTKVSETCTENREDKALKCALQKEIRTLTDIAKAAHTQEAETRPVKRQPVPDRLSVALPTLSNLLNETNLDELIKSVDLGNRWSGNAHDHSGNITLEGTRILLHYHVTHCWVMDGRKRLLDVPTITKTCKATVTEDHTKTNETCTDYREGKALKCALRKEIQALIDLAKATQAQETKPQAA